MELFSIFRAPGDGHASTHFEHPNLASQESADTTGKSLRLGELRGSPSWKNSRRDITRFGEVSFVAKALSDFVSLPSFASTWKSISSSENGLITSIVSLSNALVWSVGEPGFPITSAIEVSVFGDAVASLLV